MTVRIRETRGTSWRDPHQPGTRHYRSTSVSYGLFTWAAGLGFRSVFVLPFVILWWMILLEAWIAAEAVLLAVTGIGVIVAVARHRARAEDITGRRFPFRLYAFGLKGTRS